MVVLWRKYGLGSCFLILLAITAPTFAMQEIPKIIMASISQSTGRGMNLYGQNQIQRLTKEDLKSSRASTIIDTLATQGSVELTQKSSNPQSATLSIRGFGDTAASNSLILINNQPISNPDLAARTLDFIPLQNITTIELSPSSDSVLYGDQAVGGLLNIITKTPKAKTREVALSYGSDKSYNTRLYLADCYGDQLNYGIGITSGNNANYRAHNRFQNTNLLLNLRYQRLGLLYQNASKYLELPSALTWLQVTEDPRQAGRPDLIAHNRQDTNFFQLAFDQPLNATWLAKLAGSFEDMVGSGAYGTRQAPWYFNEVRRNLALHPKIFGTISFANYDLLPVAGLDWSSSSYTLSGIANYHNQATQQQEALYAQLAWRLTPTITATTGARRAFAKYQLNQTTEAGHLTQNTTATNLELAWQPTPAVKLFVKRAVSYRFPKTDEILATFDKKPLNPQTGISYEIGVKSEQLRWDTLFSAYNLLLKNEILFLPGQENLFNGANTNLDPTRRLGAMLNIALKATDKLNLTASYHIINATFIGGKLAGNKIPFVAANNLKTTASLNLTERWSLRGEALYTGRRYPANDVTNGAVPLGGVTIYNCALNYQQEDYNFTIRADNLTNKLYYGYVVANHPTELNNLDYYPASTLTLLATLSYTL